MGVDVEPDSIEESFLIRGLQRMTVANLKRDRMLIDAMSDNIENANQMYKDYSNMMLPELGIHVKDQEKELRKDFDYFSQFSHEIKLDDNGDIVVNRDVNNA